MKTIKEITQLRNLNRSTLLKAAQRGAFASHKSGDIWLIDDESESFKKWIDHQVVGRPRNKESKGD